MAFVIVRTIAWRVQIITFSSILLFISSLFCQNVFLDMLFSDTFKHAFPLMWDTGIHNHTKHHIKRAAKVFIKVPLINCSSCPVASLLHTRLLCNMLLGSLVIFSLPECNLSPLTNGWWVAGWSFKWWCWSDDHRRRRWRWLPLTAARKNL